MRTRTRFLFLICFFFDKKKVDVNYFTERANESERERKNAINDCDFI